jgi:uncharacterized protein YgbK (DUF1537 family)
MRFRGRLAFAATLMIFLVVLGPRSSADAAQTIDLGSFSIEPPQGPGWQVIEKKKTDIAFKLTMPGPPPRIMTSRHILVVRDSPGKKQKKMSEEQLANAYRNQEEQGMMILGTLKAKYKVEDVKKRIVTRGKRKLYFMSYRTVQTQPEGQVDREIVTKTDVYLYSRSSIHCVSSDRETDASR